VEGPEPRVDTDLLGNSVPLLSARQLVFGFVY
jgi:hypothetical protein